MTLSLFAPVLRFSNPPSEYNPLAGRAGAAKHPFAGWRPARSEGHFMAAFLRAPYRLFSASRQNSLGDDEMKIAAMVMGSALLFLSPVRAETPMTGSALLKLCEGNISQKAACESYLHGVADTLDFIASAVPAAGLMEKCVPEGIPTGKLRSVMTKMLHRKGIHRDASAASLAMTAFSAAWRCNPNGQYHDAEEQLGRAIR